MINSIDYITTYHYCTNGYIENDKYHFFIKDYQGNNRVVFDQDGTIEQLNHYYPYGGLFSEGTTNTNQPYKFGGKELDRMNGLDLYDFGARMLDSAAPTFMTMDRYAEKYPNISPYSYCGGNPIANIDVNGDSIAVLNYGTGKDQHLAILIQNKEGKWAYYSVNGNNMHSSGSGSTSGSGRSSGDSSFSGGSTTNNTGEQTYDSPQAFLDSKDNKDEYGYSSAYVIPTSPKQDRQIENSFKKESETDYNLVTNNCADAVINGMESGGLNVKKHPFSVPSRVYREIRILNPKGYFIKKR